MVYRLEQGMLIDIHESSNTYGILFAFAPTLENLEIERCMCLSTFYAANAKKTHSEIDRQFWSLLCERIIWQKVRQ